MTGECAPDPGLDLWARLLTEAGGLRPGDQVLDIGGGSGALSMDVMRRCGACAILADIHAERYMGLPAVRARADALPFSDAACDAVLMSHVLHHFPDPAAALREAARVLRPGGRILIRTASHADLRHVPHARWIPRLLDGILALVPDVLEIESWLMQAGCAVRRVEPVSTPQAIPLELYAESVQMQAIRDWALAPGATPSPGARAWVLAAFSETPPVPETLIVAERLPPDAMRP